MLYPLSYAGGAGGIPGRKLRPPTYLAPGTPIVPVAGSLSDVRNEPCVRRRNRGVR